MPTLRRLTALALARAMLAGPPTADGLAARLRACIDADAPWCASLAERCARLGERRWRGLGFRALATLVENDDAFDRAWLSTSTRPTLRHYILRVANTQRPLPAALERCHVPFWPHGGALARWLGIPTAGLWRLTRPAAWQRRTGLVDQHYRYELLPKRRGGWRLLEVPQPWLMPLQRRVLDDLLDRIPPHAAAFGYARERAVVDHARAHAGQAVVLKYDLQDFFTAVRASRVHALFETLGYPEDVVHDLTALCTTATPEPVLRRLHRQGSLTWQQLQRLRDPHLPQGAPSSPALANLCSFNLDRRLAALAESLGARYTRYADDLVISGGAPLRGAASRIGVHVARIARDEGFELNHRKTRSLSAGTRQAVCGIVVNAHPNLPRDEFDRLKAILHQCVRDGPAAQNRDGHADWRGHLRGRVAWAAQINAGKAARLKQLFDRIDWSR